MAFEHPSGLPFSYDRALSRPEIQQVIFYGERPYIQTSELTEMGTIVRALIKRLGRVIVSDGDRIERGDAFVDIDAETVTIEAGRVYADGDVWDVPARVLSEVPMSGRTEVGIRLVTDWITSEDDPTLLGLVPGSDGEGEEGAAREIRSATWSHQDADEDGLFFSVYTLQDGVILDQTGPNILAPALQSIIEYDRPNGNYIVNGCRVTWLATDAGKQIFSISEGEANINGYKRTRLAALRHEEIEDWDELLINGETHTYPGGASHTFSVDVAPIGTINTILLTKQKSVAVTRGAIANGADGLPDTSVTEIVSVVQGGTTYVQGTDFTRVANAVDWGLVGAEPAAGSTYTVTYRYRATVVAEVFNDTQITVSGGAAGGDILVTYTSKLPRIDRLCLSEDGSPLYIKGISARSNPRPPGAPSDALKLCQIRNDWMSPPQIIVNGVDDGVIFPTAAQHARVYYALLDMQRLFGLERLKNATDAREPVAKKGIFVDPFQDDSYRDEGVVQTGAIVDGILQLAIDPTFYETTLTAPVTLDGVEEVIISQELKSQCELINPYANFNFLPASMALQPPVDFWTVSRNQWLSAQTREFNRGVQTNGGPLTTTSTTTQLIDTRSELIEFLRQITVTFSIEGFAPGEILDELTFDGVDVKPAGVLTANPDGEISDTFVIPENVTAGTKTVFAKGQGGSEATALFAGQGTIETQIMRRVTTINRWTRRQIERRENGDRGSDPQAQLFAVPELRQVIGLDFHLCGIGDTTKDIVVNQVTTANGYPTADIQAEAFVSMAGAAVGWKSARFMLPVTTGPQSLHGHVIKTDDNLHAVSIAKLGGFDAELQQKISRHPYVVAPRFSSVNAETWTAHQDEALAFRVVAWTYPVTTKTVPLGSFDLVDCSDLQVRAEIELPSNGCSVEFEVERTNGTIYRLAEGQVLQFNEFLTETIELRAVLKGTSKLSPILYAPVQLVAGQIHEELTYVTRAFDLGELVRIAAYYKAYLPGGSSVAMEISKDGGAWEALPLDETEGLAFPLWVERKHELTNQTATTCRLKITGTGGPASRLLIGDFSAAVF
ncbi:MAG: DUF4815 domain-containing protein [Rhizobiales bacterium]|nr:DUF4815 domain-containing protein [Hyphomicrobiales bacterium]